MLAIPRPRRSKCRKENVENMSKAVVNRWGRDFCTKILPLENCWNLPKESCVGSSTQDRWFFHEKQYWWVEKPSSGNVSVEEKD